MSDTATELVAALEAEGYTVLSPRQSLDQTLLNRMEGLASDLQVIDGLTRRGAVLPHEYRFNQLGAMKRMFARLVDALEAGEAAVHPWEP